MHAIPDASSTSLLNDFTGTHLIMIFKGYNERTIEVLKYHPAIHSIRTIRVYGLKWKR